MYKLYGIPNCGSVKKARTFLEANDISYEFINFKQQPADTALITDWMQQRSWEEILNKKGTSFRTLSPDQKESIQSADTAQTFILENNSLIKRPVITQDETIVAVGFDETLYRSIFGK